MVASKQLMEGLRLACDDELGTPAGKVKKGKKAKADDEAEAAE